MFLVFWVVNYYIYMIIVNVFDVYLIYILDIILLILDEFFWFFFDGKVLFIDIDENFVIGMVE